MSYLETVNQGHTIKRMVKYISKSGCFPSSEWVFRRPYYGLNFYLIFNAKHFTRELLVVLYYAFQFRI